MQSKLSWLRRGIVFVQQHHKRITLLTIKMLLVACVLSAVLQLAYPSDRTLIGTKLAGTFVSFKDSDQVKRALQKLDQKEFILKLGDKGYAATPSSAGLTFASNANVREVLRYPLSQRLIPFSILFQHKSSIQKHLRVDVNMSRVEAFAGELATKSNTQPTEGVITVQDSKVITHPPKPGLHFEATEVVTVLKGLSGNIPKEVAIAGQPRPPVYSASAVQAAAKQATQFIEPFTITINNKDYTAPATTVGSWLTFTPNAQTKQIDIGFDNAVVENYLDTIAKQVYRSPTTTTVTLLDNHKTSEKSGSTGSYLDTAVAAQGVIAAVMQKQTVAMVSLSVIASPVTYVHTYSATSAGLQAQLDDWVAAHRGATWGIKIIELGGKNRSAGYSSTASFMPASIYKLYVSYTAQSEISAGTLNASAITSVGKSVSTCLDIMIVNSDNPCAKAVADMVGWDQVTADAHAAGFTHTNLSASSLSSTPSDTALFLEKLASGTLMDSTQTSALIGRMERQIYRSGLPAGSRGATVADKVGFINSYLHDAGIIYYAGHNYIISVFSIGGSWSQIANLASTISSYTNTH